MHGSRHLSQTWDQSRHLLPGLRTVGFERRVTIAFRVLKTEVEIVTIAYAGRHFEDDL